jgi:shikimate kinase
MRVFLVGFMGAGKSTTGRALARRLEALFWDLDGRV